MKSVEDHEAVRLRFRLRSGSAGLLQEKKRCGLSGNDICLLCDSGDNNFHPVAVNARHALTGSNL